MKKTTSMVKTADIKRDWHLVDCTGQTLGRLSTRLAGLLTGKHKPAYTPHMDMGDHVVVINAKDIQFTGNKLMDKYYYRHSGHPGGFTQESAGNLLVRDPRKIIEHAVAGMLAKNKLQDPRLRRLKVYKSATHPHVAQFTKKDQI
ncbi:MAG: 50S ribosomal protein L13 [Microgenomates group bacterium GW2011_GWC2_45_8]|nr:MAG: 50S ribosomal protein L13 [Microgenomates group bacterium GW2011_GWC2_45_8]